MTNLDFPVNPEKPIEYIVDYDIPIKPASERMQFYREFWDLKSAYTHFTIKFSTCSVFCTRFLCLAVAICGLAKKYKGDSHLYVAKQLL